MTKILTEGMRGGDLEDMVLPMLSVDEFESKIDNDAIVFGFFVDDFDAAQDLNRFIQKSAVDLLDTEVSPAPDEHGYYFVFFEMLKDKDLPENVGKVLDEVSELAKIDHWQLRVRGLKELVSFNHKVLANLPGDEKGASNALQESLFKFLKPSCLSNADLTGDNLTLEGSGHRGNYKVVAFDDAIAINFQYSLSETFNDFSLKNIAKQNRLLKMLGEGWDVMFIQGLYKLAYEGSTHILVLEDR